VGKNWLPLSLIRYFGVVPPTEKRANGNGSGWFSKDRKAHDAAGIVIQDDGHPPTPRPALRPSARGPRAPESQLCGPHSQIDMPDVVGTLGGDDAAFGFHQRWSFLAEKVAGWVFPCGFAQSSWFPGGDRLVPGLRTVSSLPPGTTESNINRCLGNVLRKTRHSGKIAGLGQHTPPELGRRSETPAIAYGLTALAASAKAVRFLGWSIFLLRP
jgi:hypothetical protein